MSEANITIPVDLTNPGQFFACCGLLELVSRIDAETLACFRGEHFVLQTSATNALALFLKCEIAIDTDYHASDADDEEGGDGDDDVLNPNRGRVFPMYLGSPFNLRLDWWTDEHAKAQKLKLWTAGQRVTDLLTGHYKNKPKKGRGVPKGTKEKVYTPSTREHLADVCAKYPQDWLRKAVPITSPGAFSYDSRLSRNNALDLGHFSAGTFAFSPAADVLSLIALQRFRPLMVEVWNRNQYCTWKEFMPVSVAPACVVGAIPSLVDRRFEFPIKARDSQGRFKLFGHAQPIRSSNA